MSKNRNNWLFSFLLTLPVCIFIIFYFLKFHTTLISPGFLQYDNITYMAYARQYLDADNFSLFYSNPFNESGNYPKIYFQIQNFIFLIFQKTGIPPGYILIVFTWVFSLITFRILISIFDHLLPGSKNRFLSIVFFAWGGGLLTLTGIAGLEFISVEGMDIWDRLFVLDPDWGWWGLNLGRSLLFSTEAFYHALFFGGILCILKKKWETATLLALLLFLSHPFTGVEYLGIVCFWLLFEVIIKKNKAIPLWFGLAMLLILAAHLYYYMMYLPQFPDHKSVHQQCSVNMHLRYYNMLPAYCIAGILCLLSLWRAHSLQFFFSQPQNRLFACWFIITILLVNHEMFMKPMQPVHFTRGYVWSSLFLLGLPGLDWLLDYFKKKKYYVVAIFLFSFLFLSDNLLWLLNYSRKKTQTHLSIYISKEQNNVLSWLEKNTDNTSLVISSDNIISMLNTVYSKSYSWTSHNLATPFLAKKQQAYSNFLLQNKLDTAWLGRKLIFIMDSDDSLEKKRLQHLPFTPDSMIQMHNYFIVLTGLKKKSIFVTNNYR